MTGFVILLKDVVNSLIAFGPIEICWETSAGNYKIIHMGHFRLACRRIDMPKIAGYWKAYFESNTDHECSIVLALTN